MSRAAYVFLLSCSLLEGHNACPPHVGRYSLDIPTSRSSWHPLVAPRWSVGCEARVLTQQGASSCTSSSPKPSALPSSGGPRVGRSNGLLFCSRPFIIGAILGLLAIGVIGTASLAAGHCQGCCSLAAGRSGRRGGLALVEPP